MCDARSGSGIHRTTPRPEWGRLYVFAALTVAMLAAVEIVAAPGAFEAGLLGGLALGGFAAMAWWTRRNRAALDCLDWCDCAGAKVTVRVIASRPSRRSEPLRARPTYPAIPAEAFEEVVR